MDLQDRAERLAQLMEDRLGTGGKGFGAKLKRAGRRLPRRLRRDGALIQRALELLAHPRLSRQIDQADLTRAADHFERHLRQIDPWARRRGLMLNWLAGIAFSLLVVAGVLITVLRMRGLI